MPFVLHNCVTHYYCIIPYLVFEPILKYCFLKICYNSKLYTHTDVDSGSECIIINVTVVMFICRVEHEKMMFSIYMHPSKKCTGNSTMGGLNALSSISFCDFSGVDLRVDECIECMCTSWLL